MNWPNPLSGSSAFGSWMNSLLRACRASEIVSVVGGKLTKTTNGKVLVIDEKQVGGQAVYVKACLEDGTECYVPIKVFGTIYRDRADAPGTTPTIDTGKVPDGSPELI